MAIDDDELKDYLTGKKGTGQGLDLAIKHASDAQLADALKDDEKARGSAKMPQPVKDKVTGEISKRIDDIRKKSEEDAKKQGSAIKPK